MRRCLVALALVGLTAAAHAVDLFTVVRVDADRLQLFWRDDQGQALRRLDRLAAWQQAAGKRLVFGMNAGMYHEDARPVGLLVIEGREWAPLNLGDGAGNFFLKPNGVFLIDALGARVVDAADYAAVVSGRVRLATQSGPLLLKNGHIHPAFRASSASRHVRNGVCVQGTQVVFVISERPVSLHEFASYFLDELHCQDALYLDGAVSSLWSPSRRRHDRWHALGPLFGVAE